MENEQPITAAPTAGSRKISTRGRLRIASAGGSRCGERCQMSTLRAQNRKPGRDDRDFVEIQMRGTTRELAQIQGEGSSPKPMETTIESRVRSPNARYQVSCYIIPEKINTPTSKRCRSTIRCYLLPPPTISVIATASEEHENYNDNQNGCHSFLQKIQGNIPPPAYGFGTTTSLSCPPFQVAGA